MKRELIITINGFNTWKTEKMTLNITKQVLKLKKKFKGPWPLKTKKKRICLLTSPHKHKDAQEQFERRIHRKRIVIEDELDFKEMEQINKLFIPDTV